jgi:hypothetical protein
MQREHRGLNLWFLLELNVCPNSALGAPGEGCTCAAGQQGVACGALSPEDVTPTTPMQPAIGEYCVG